MQRMIENLRIGPYAMRYSQFVPRLYNYCRSLGFERDRMMPSRAFCSDESQGYPVILLAQHFGTFPFDHGRVGGKVAVNRHGPYAHHGEDLVIIQASHVGYDADTGRFGVYKRHRTDGSAMGANCGKLSAVLQWYQEEYRHAREQVLCGTLDDEDVVVIDNQFLDPRRHEGLFLHLEMMVIGEPVKVMSTAKVFRPSMALRDRLPAEVWQNKPQPIGAWLTADLFSFQRAAAADIEGHDILEVALAPAMPALVTSANPALDAARHTTQVEFDRTYRSILRANCYDAKNLLFISGVNVDISPREAFPFPLIKFVPWAAYGALRDGRTFLLEQRDLSEALRAQPLENPDKLSFDESIQLMAGAEEVKLPVD
jgi:Limiting CO2-inducible proteins B/C beta carbonyic anhydrases